MTSSTETQDAVRKALVVSGHDGLDPFEVRVTSPCAIGRDEECLIRIDAPLVSRRHAELVFEEGTWWINDLGSTNGIYVGGERINRIRLDGDTDARFGKDGPSIHFHMLGAPAQPLRTSSGETSPPQREGSVALEPGYTPLRLPGHGAEAAPSPGAPEGEATEDDEAFPFVMPEISWNRPPVEPTPSRPPGTRAPRPRRPGEPAAAEAPMAKEPGRADSHVSTPGEGPRREFTSAEEAAQHYFGAREGPVGEHTMFIRQAYGMVQKKQQRTYVGLIVAVTVVCLAALGYAGYQEYRFIQLSKAADDYALRMRESEVVRAKMISVLVRGGSTNLDEQLAILEEERHRDEEAYDAYVEKFGVRRSLTAEEREIYRVARAFNESEFSMPDGFVKAVMEMINNHWKGSGRGTLALAFRRAEENGYTPHIVRTFQKYGLPPQFYYLAMQESVFNPQVSGVPTRWGIAKGMWQFIPPTGQAYGLRIGPLEGQRVYDPLDERQDFLLSTDAAARYLLDITGKLTQASGLLAMASYNWGEGRVISKLDENMSGVPNTVQARSYWRFYTEYKDRMPEETKDYVLKIFSAAVIGENPRLFGFDFDPPLAKYLGREAATDN